MTPEGKKALWFYCCVAAMLVPMVAVPTVTLSLPHWRFTPSLDDPNPAVRVAALRATGWHGHIVPLIRALQDEDADVRVVAAMYLKRRSKEAGPRAKALIALLKDEREDVRSAAAGILYDIGAAAAPVLVDALTDTDPRVRAKAAWALEVVAFEDQRREVSLDDLASIASALEKLLQDEDAEVRRSAAETLERVRRAQAGEKFVRK